MLKLEKQKWQKLFNLCHKKCNQDYVKVYKKKNMFCHLMYVTLFDVSKAWGYIHNIVVVPPLPSLSSPHHHEKSE